MIAPLIRKLERLGPLSDEEKGLLEAFPLEVRHVEAQHMRIQGDAALLYCHLLLEGVAYRYKVVGDSRRQIMSFHMAGDILDLSSLLSQLDNNVGALTRLSVALIPHAVMIDWLERLPRLGRLLWRNTLVDAAVLGEWVVNSAQRTAGARVAHLLCELAARMRAVDPRDGDECDLPVTHLELADATGLSVVHVSRVLRELHDQGLVALGKRSVMVRDPDELGRATGYDQGYLHPLGSAA